MENSVRMESCSRRLPFLFAALLLILAPSTSLAQKIVFQHLTNENGLSSTDVKTLVQDRHGFIWIGTSEGLYRYDGYELTAYRHNPTDPSSLGSGVVTSIVEDPAGRLWVATYGDGLSRLQPRTGAFSHYRHDPDNPKSLSSDQVSDLHMGSDGGLWVGTIGGGLNRFDFQAEAFRRYDHDEGDPAGAISDSITVIRSDRRGRLWMGSTGDGLGCLYLASGQFTSYRHDAGDPASLSADVIEAILVDRHGTLWVGTIGGGLDRFDAESGTFNHFRHDDSDPASLSNDIVTAVAEDKQGRLWIGTDSGLNRLDQQAQTFTHFRHDPLDPGSLSRDSLLELYSDRQGTLWAVPLNSGIDRFETQGETFKSYLHDADDPNSLGDNFVWSLYQDRMGKLWAGTQSGLDRFEPETGAFTHYRHEINNPASLSRGSVRVIAQDREGRIWVGTDTGLDRFQPRSGTFEHYRHEPSQPHTLPQGRVLDIAEDQAGRLWIGLTSGLASLDPQRGTFTHYVHRPSEAHSLSNNYVWRVYPDQQGGIWIGTAFGGLNRLDPESGRFRSHRHDAADPSSISSDDIQLILEDRQGRLWIGTRGGGLNLFDAQREEFTHYTVHNSGFPDNNIQAVLVDSAGTLWIGTSGGKLVRFDPDTGKIRTFDHHDGLRFRAFFAAQQNPAGLMYFGGDGGLIEFSPQQIIDNPYPPQIALTQLRLFNQIVLPDPGSPLQDAPENTAAISLAPGQNDLSFDFVGLHFANPAKHEYAYRLKPYDQRWREVGSQRTATYTGLAPGDYELSVKAANSTGAWSSEGAPLLRIALQPFFYQTTSFYLLCVVGLVLSGLGVHRYRIRVYRRRERDLQEQVRSRTKNLSEQKQRLQQALETVASQAEKLESLDAAKSRFFANISHEFRTPLTLIAGPLEDLRDHRHGPLRQDAAEQVKVALENSRQLLHLVDQLLDTARLESGRLTLDVQSVDTGAFLEDIAQRFSALAAQKKIDFQVQLPETTVTACFDADQIEKVVANLLSNAFKFTAEAGKISLGLKTQRDEARDDWLVVTVSDTGPGIAEEHLPHLFERFYQADDSATRQQSGSGIGLSLAHELVALHKGTISVKSALNQGTTITVRLPLAEVRPAAPRLDDTPVEELLDQGAGWIPALAGEILPAGQGAGQSTGIELGKELEGDDVTTVMVVDDNAYVRAYLRRHLSSSYRVLQAADGKEALECAREALPDLIVSDVMMPLMDGLSLCRAIKADPETDFIPVILLTAKASIDSKVEGLETGADDYLTKPFNVRELKVRIANLIESRHKLIARFRTEDPALTLPFSQPSSPRDESFLEEVRTVITNRLGDEDFDVEELASEVGQSRSSLYRRFESLLSQSPLELIWDMRLRQASQMLKACEGTVSEVAYSVGFKSVSHFSKKFRNQFGTSPSSFLTKT